MAKWLKVSGDEVSVEPKNGTDFTLEELKRFVGGYIEIIRLRNGKLMVVNEEGKLNRLPINDYATLIWEGVYGCTDVIVGDVLVCKEGEIK